VYHDVDGFLLADFYRQGPTEFVKYLVRASNLFKKDIYGYFYTAPTSLYREPPSPNYLKEISQASLEHAKGLIYYQTPLDKENIYYNTVREIFLQNAFERVMSGEAANSYSQISS